jgi:hypothetical protein
MTMHDRHPRDLKRRAFLTGGMGLLGAGAMMSTFGGWPGRARAETHFAPRARRVVYLFMSGGPSQLESFDYKPGLSALNGTPLPESIRNGQRLTTMTSTMGSFPVVAPRVTFAQYGESGAWVSNLFPYTAQIVDQISIVRTMRTDAINHDPAILMMQSGAILSGRPSFGAWMSHALGSATEDLPAFSVLLSTEARGPGQPLFSSYWGSGFLPAEHQGVRFSGGPEPVLYLEDGAALPMASRVRLRDTRRSLDELHHARTGHDDILGRIEANELALRMQSSVPELTNLGDEPESTFTLYGDEARVPGTFSANCLLARRLLERGSTFVQLFHRDWDHHNTMQTDHPALARSVDRASAALVQDLARRGLLEDTLVIWGGEFGRTVYGQNAITNEQYGRDHHPRCFSMWMAGGGIRPGYVHGETDDYSYNVVSGGVHVHDFHATLLQLLGFDHTRLTYRAEGRDFRLTDVSGNVIADLLA